MNTTTKLLILSLVVYYLVLGYFNQPREILINNAKAETINLNEPKTLLERITAIEVKNGLKGGIMLKTLKCESGLNNKAVGDHGLAVGIAQFHEKTFKDFENLSGFRGNYYNENDQLELMGWAFKNGLAHHWSCYK